MKHRLWLLILDCSILLTRLADRIYLHAWHKVNPPRATDAEQFVRAVKLDNARPTQADFERLSE